MFKHLTSRDERAAHRLLGLHIVPGRSASQMGLVFDVQLIDFFGGPNGWHKATMTVDMDVALTGHSLQLSRPCVREVKHDLDERNMGPRMKELVLREALTEVFGMHYGFTLPSEGLNESVTHWYERPVTRMEVKDDSLTFELGLVDSPVAKPLPWPDPLSEACSVPNERISNI
jgi:hypothetical protein